MSSFVGEGFASTNGILQGCPMSVVMLNLLMQVWATEISTQVPGSTPMCYADDANATCSRTTDVQRILDLTEEFAELTGMSLNLDKSVCWSTNKRQRRQLTRVQSRTGRKLPVVTSMRFLGAEVNFTRGSAGGKHVQKRLLQAEQACSRIEHVPLGIEARANLVQATVIPRVLYDAPLRPLTKDQRRTWRTRAARAVWGGGARFRCHETLFTLLSKGHGCDPVQAEIYRALNCSRRLLRKYPEQRQQWQQVWREATSPGATKMFSGPVRQVIRCAEALGMHMVDDLTLESTDGQQIWLLEQDEEQFQHNIREILRRKLWTELSHRRPTEFGGMDLPHTDVDRAATMALHNKVSGKEKRLLQELMTGCVRSRSRAKRINRDDCDVCFFCGEEPEDTEHILHRCPAWAHMRTECADHLPACTRQCGIALHDPEVAASEAALQGLREPDAHASHHPGGHTTSDHFTIVFTDGACSEQSHQRYRRAGCGGWWGVGHTHNFSFALPGENQTNQRAELTAVLHAALRESSPLEIRTDSKYVVDGFRRLQNEGLDSMRSHNDLWTRLLQNTTTRATPVRIVKVLGHAKWRDVHCGRETAENKTGNAHADKLAVQGAQKHPHAHALGRLCRETRQRTLRLQRMFLNILLEQSELTEEIYEARRVQAEELRAVRPRLHHLALPNPQ